MIYTKRQGTVEALEFTKENGPELAKWTKGIHTPSIGGDLLHIYGKQHMMVAVVGDWVVRDTDGSFHAVPRETFGALFDPVVAR